MAKDYFWSTPAAGRITTTSPVTGRPCSSPAWTRTGSLSSGERARPRRRTRAELGNFGVAAVSPTESWVTVSEGVWNDAARTKGADGSTFVALVIWSKPNSLFTDAGGRGTR